MKLAVALLGLGMLLLLFLAMREGKTDTGGKQEDAAALPGAKSPRSRGRDPGQEAERAETKRAQEALRRDPGLKNWWEEGTLENFFVRDLIESFDGAELTRLAKTKNLEDNGEYEAMARLVVRAAAEKHPGFQDLLSRPELRKKPMLDMALCAYDYAVNGNRVALERMDAFHRGAAGTDQGGFDGPAAWALGYVNEWDVTKQMLEAQPSEGEIDDIRRAFWIKRRYFFPQNRDFPDDYDQFVREMNQAQRGNQKEEAPRSAE